MNKDLHIGRKEKYDYNKKIELDIYREDMTKTMFRILNLL